MTEIPQCFYIFVESADGFAKALAEGERAITVGEELMIMKEVVGNRITVRRLVIDDSPPNREGIEDE